MHIPLFLVTAAVACSVYAAEDPLIAQISNKSFWEKTNWASFDTSSVQKWSGWQEYPGEQEAHRTRYKQGAVNFLGQEYSVSFGKNNDDQPLPAFFALSAMAKGSQSCDTAIGWATKRFGKTSGEIDGTHTFQFGESADKLIMLQRAATFDIGGTVLTVICLGMLGPVKPSNIGLVLEWEPIARKKMIKPMFALTCDQIIEHADGTKKAISPLTILVDEYFNKVRTMDKRLIGSKTKIDQNQISFTDTRKFVTEFAIDRVTGMLHATINNEHGREVATVRGTCEKSADTARKF